MRDCPTGSLARKSDMSWRASLVGSNWLKDSSHCARVRPFALTVPPRRRGRKYVLILKPVSSHSGAIKMVLVNWAPLSASAAYLPRLWSKRVAIKWLVQVRSTVGTTSSSRWSNSREPSWFRGSKARPAYGPMASMQ